MNRHMIALAQINPALGDLERNLALHEKTAEEAIGRGASLLIFPELSLTGYFLKDIVSSVALPLTSPILGRLRDLSRRIDL
ncbi:MAG: carbon-nitrogen hydrolase, partial [candidate division NC10 bacterium]|nr:carbon-nitrogen hydrolase [candidate division NC10 bacterium]